MESFDWKTFLFSFDGRIPRSFYWLKYFVPYMLIVIVLSALEAMTGFGLFATIMSIIGIIAIWPGLAVSIKRLHDRDKSGWWILLAFVPIVAWIWALVEIGCLRGTVGDNQYGPDPTPEA